MNRKEAAELLPIIKAFSEGKTLQIRQNGSEWMDIETASFTGFPSEYRIKPESKYRPFKDAEECWQEMQKHQPFGWLKDSDSCYLHIVSMEIKFIGAVNSSGNIISQFYSGFYSDYTFADGTPFGVKVEEK